MTLEGAALQELLASLLMAHKTLLPSVAGMVVTYARGLREEGHPVPDPQNLPKIFTKETTQVARSALVEERVRPQVAKYVELLDGAGYSVAVANADAKALERANFVCPPVQEEGVAQVIEAMLAAGVDA